MSAKQSANGGEVIVEFQSEESNEAKWSSSKGSESSAPKQSKVTTGSSGTGFSKPVSPDISRANPYSGKPPRAPNRNESINRRKSFNRSVTKPKSRFGEPSQIACYV
ncbi:hypothetical protein ACLB2K_014690 [Fragaria x ananassa]